MAACLALACWGVALAQVMAPGGSNQPVQIQADSGVEWQQNAHLYIARGNAVATRGDSEVHADTLIAHYREAKGGNTNTGGNTEIYRVEAEGHVILKRGAQTVVGDRAIYDVDKAIAVVTGKGLKMTTSADVVTARDSLEWYDQKQIAVARGNAVAVRNGKTIKADVLTAYMVKTPAGPGQPGAAAAQPIAARGKPPAAGAAAGGAVPPAESKIDRVDAQGHVVVTNELETGHGNFGVYNAKTGLATLIGDVVVERGKDVIRGQRAVMDLNKNISRMMPGGAPGAATSAATSAAHQRVQGLLVREEGGVRPAGTAVAPGRNPPATGKKP